MKANGVEVTLNAQSARLSRPEVIEVFISLLKWNGKQNINMHLIIILITDVLLGNKHHLFNYILLNTSSCNEKRDYPIGMKHFLVQVQRVLTV